MNKEEEINDKKSKKRNKFKAIWRKTEGFRDLMTVALIVIIVIGVIIAFIAHLYLFISLAGIIYKNDLNYCEYIYGLGWKQSYTAEIGYFCVFTEEDGNKIIHQMSTEDRKSRVCERKFYHPSYCG